MKLNQARDVITVTQELNKELEKKVKKSEEETKKMVTNHSRWIQSELTKIQCPRCTMKIFGLKTLTKHIETKHAVTLDFSQLEKDIKKKMEEETLRLIDNAESSRNAAAGETSGKTILKLSMKRCRSSSSVMKKTNDGSKVVKKKKTTSSHDNAEIIQID